MLRLATDFKVEDESSLALPLDCTPPTGGMRFSDFHPVYQEVVKSTFLSVVLIKNATEADIEELFYRLNNGKPLNAAERRNALGGDMAGLIREAAGRPFFTRRVRLSNDRYLHFDLAARMLLIEHACATTGSPPDLTSSTLDDFVRTHRRLPAAERTSLLKRLDDRLAFLDRVFGDADPLLSNQSYPPIYYMFIRSITRPAAEQAPGTVRDFLSWFQSARRRDLDKAEEQRDESLAEFSRLIQDAATSRRALGRSVQILTYHFGTRHPELTGHGRVRST